LEVEVGAERRRSLDGANGTAVVAANAATIHAQSRVNAIMRKELIAALLYVCRHSAKAEFASPAVAWPQVL
jgi:hypothetical protein